MQPTHYSNESRLDTETVGGCTYTSGPWFRCSIASSRAEPSQKRQRPITYIIILCCERKFAIQQFVPNAITIYQMNRNINATSRHARSHECCVLFFTILLLFMAAAHAMYMPVLFVHSSTYQPFNDIPKSMYYNVDNFLCTQIFHIILTHIIIIIIQHSAIFCCCCCCLLLVGCVCRLLFVAAVTPST